MDQYCLLHSAMDVLNPIIMLTVAINMKISIDNPHTLPTWQHSYNEESQFWKFIMKTVDTKQNVGALTAILTLSVNIYG